jgi:hypothetical protein
MGEKIQLLHPHGKKLARIDKDKYDLIRKAILKALKKGPLQHAAMLETILADFKKGKVKFEGAVEWYMEGVKLDLEATKVILRTPDKPPYQWLLAPGVR